VRGICDLVQRDVVSGRGRIALRLVDSRLNDRMRERQIFAREEFLIRDRFAAPLSLPAIAPRRRGPQIPRTSTFI